ncbi:MAG: hypothetical protein JKY83_03765 [Rhizobiaceae bacterium]|nr:hypothetical protein [Rhizobiaceae bacterium]
MTDLFIWVAAIVILAAIVLVIFAWFYERATNEVSLIRTGVGGRKVILEGGTLAIPYLHETSRVNMQTLSLDVARSGDASLITKDRLRVDIGAEFHLSVVPTQDGVNRAAQTLGRRTFQADQLRTLLDGVMVDALRSVAAQMTLDQLHENRAKFSTEVRENIEPVLERYGLQLDSISLTAMDQTAFSSLDENNAFNAVGMRKLAEVIALSKKERAIIDSEAEVAVRKASMEASKRKLEIDLEERRAEISQQQDIEVLMAAQIAEVARQKADSEREAAQARIQMEQAIQTAEIEREQALEIAEQERNILTAEKSQDESQAQAKADAALVAAVESAEAVTTARKIAKAERQLEVAVVAARQKAKTAKENADARRIDADARKYETLASAESRRAHIEAENKRSSEIIAMEIEKARLEAAPKIVAEMVKPAEKIKSININHLSGGFGQTSSTGGAGGDKPVINQAIDSIMEMAVQMPALKAIGDSIGLSLEEGQASAKPAGKAKKK